MNTTRCLVTVMMVCLAASFKILAGPVSLTRYALVVGSNTGDAERRELKYAVSDAESFARVLMELGGVRQDRCMVMKNPDKRGFLRGLGRLKTAIHNEKALQGRKEVVIYYSGHADERGILLGREGFAYKEIRDTLHQMGVDVRIAVLDACASGSFTREKGGTHRPPFLYDMSTVTEGYAFLTSSSADEVSQESDAIRSSFFTHYLVSGMRGPADANRDGKVTLNEAYEFAYDETLQRTEKTSAGPQHASYDIRLKGSGDLVLTDLRTSSAVLRLMPALTGRIFVHDAQGHLLVELSKSPGKKLEIGLEPGEFEVLVHSSDGVSAGNILLKEGGVTEVTGSELHKVKQVAHRLRGAETMVDDSYARIPFNMSFLPQLSISGRYNKTKVYASLSLLAGMTEWLHGAELSSGISVVTETMTGVQVASIATLGGEVTGLQLSGVANLVKGSVKGLQIASVVNTSTSGLTGLQLSGAVNFSGKDVAGGQVASAANHLQGNLSGVQLSGGYNFSGGAIRGIQIASACNVANESSTGIQITGCTNIAPAGFAGCGIAGGVNVTGCMTGLQIAGGINVTGDFIGIQIAPVNISRKMTGLQLGVFNICDTVDGVPLAVFSYVRSNPPRYRVYLDEAGFVTAGVRSGGEYFYSLLSLGTTTVSLTGYQWYFGAGFGARLPVKKGYFAVESMANQVHVRNVWDLSPVFHVRNSVIYAYTFTPGFSLWVGPSLNIGIAWREGKMRNSYREVTYERHLQHWHAYWPGITGGIEL
ncbi:MAG: caspase family protein [Chitinispirillaceae bacterium]|nr:caspase family protein [Chitinispirillaceae bacterium]